MDRRLWMQFPVSPNAKRDNWVSIYVDHGLDGEELDMLFEVLKVARTAVSERYDDPDKKPENE